MMETLLQNDILLLRHCLSQSLLTSSQFVSFHLQRRDDLVTLLIGASGDGVARVAVGVNNRVTPLPTDDDRVFAPGGAVQLFILTLYSHSGVGMGGNHGWDWRDRARDNIY